MKKKISILGSTGSIGKNLLKIINKNKDYFKITLLSANKNYKLLLNQAKLYNVKNLVISNTDSYYKLKKFEKKFSIKVYNNFDNLKKIFKFKNDYTMSAISGLDGLKPTLNSINYTKNILIANKESIICGWNLIEKKLNKYKTNFIPIDSEHFSIWTLIDSNNKKYINKIYLTASGGPFYNYPKNKFFKITPKNALKHPNWKMGKKISIDSATLMNKVFEVIEARNIFNIPLNKINILVHPQSYLHAIVKFKTGISKFLIHETSMMIPIYHALYGSMKNSIKIKDLDFDKLNNLNLSAVDKSKFPSVCVLDIIPEKTSLFETILVSANDELVGLFLDNKIKFNDIVKILLKIIKMKQFVKFKKIKPNKIMEILSVSNNTRKLTRSLVTNLHD